MARPSIVPSVWLCLEEYLEQCEAEYLAHLRHAIILNTLLRTKP